MFGKEIVLIEKKIEAEHMGYFKIMFKYIPLNYNIVFESDRDLGTGDAKKDRIMILPFIDSFEIEKLSETCLTMAETEGLDGHGLTVKVRLK